MTDIGASLAAKCSKGRRAADPATGAEVPLDLRQAGTVRRVSAARPPRTGRSEAEGKALCRRLGRVKRKPARRGASAPAAGSRARPLLALPAVLHPATAGPISLPLRRARAPFADSGPA